MRRENLRMAVAALLTGTLLACGGNQGPVAPIPVGLTGITWRLTSLGAGSGVPSAGGPELTLQLTTGRSASGFSGCNRFRTSYMLNGDTLRFGPLVTTRVACPGDFTSEQRYISALSATNRFQVSADSLVLFQGPTAGLVFKP